MSPPAVLPGWKPRKTLIDLYNEKNATPWYFGVGATLSAMMLAVGFFIFSSALVQNCHSTTTLTSSLIGALVLLILAYVIFTINFVYSKSWIFQVDILCIPHLSSSILGLISLLYALSIHDGALSTASSPAQFGIAALVLSILSTVVYSILSAFVFRKIIIVRARDALFHLAPQTKEPGPLREDEEQRQQLSRLLHQQDEKKNRNSPASATQTTFKIEWPGHNKLQSQRSSLFSLNAHPSPAMTSKYAGQSSQTDHASEHPPGGIDRLPSITVDIPSRFSAWFNTNQRTSTFAPPTTHLTAGINALRPLSHQTPSPPTPSPHPSSPTTLSPATDDPAPLQPVAYVPPSRHARYVSLLLDSSSQPGTPQSALPSYTAYAHPSLEISTRPLEGGGGGEGWGEEKKEKEKEPDVYKMPVGGQQRPRREGWYRMADGG